MKTEPVKVVSKLWWVVDICVNRLPSGRWVVKASSTQANGVKTAPIHKVAYAPKTCETPHNAICWVSHSKTWKRLRLHSQGSQLLQMVKAKFPEDDCRKEIFKRFHENLRAEFENGYLYKNEDAQNLIARVVLGYKGTLYP
jgi:hypothetical protein